MRSVTWPGCSGTSIECRPAKQQFSVNYLNSTAFTEAIRPAEHILSAPVLNIELNWFAIRDFAEMPTPGDDWLIRIIAVHIHSCGSAASFRVLMTQYEARPVEPGAAEHDDF